MLIAFLKSPEIPSSQRHGLLASFTFDFLDLLDFFFAGPFELGSANFLLIPAMALAKVLAFPGSPAPGGGGTGPSSSMSVSAFFFPRGKAFTLKFFFKKMEI